MNSAIRSLTLLASLCCVFSSGAASPAAADKPRLIVITDIGTEPDDVQSVVRLLTYANDLEIEGLIASISRHLPNQVHPEFIQRRVEAYREALPNLRVHDARYPDADVLAKRIRAADPIYGLQGVGKQNQHAAAARLRTARAHAIPQRRPRSANCSAIRAPRPSSSAICRCSRKEPRPPSRRAR